MKLWACPIVHTVASMLLAISLGTSAWAQTPRLKNIDLCNGKDGASPDLQIEGCTALIDSEQEGGNTLSIAYNNRGNAYTAKGEYDRAIEDYDLSIRRNPAYARAYNNR